MANPGWQTSQATKSGGLKTGNRITEDNDVLACHDLNLSMQFSHTHTPTSTPDNFIFPQTHYAKFLKIS